MGENAPPVPSAAPGLREEPAGAASSPQLPDSQGIKEASATGKAGAKGLVGATKVVSATVEAEAKVEAVAAGEDVVDVAAEAKDDCVRTVGWNIFRNYGKAKMKT